MNLKFRVSPMSAPTGPDAGIRDLLARWTDAPAMFADASPEDVSSPRARFAVQMADAGGPPPRPPEVRDAGGVPVRLHRPASATSDALVVFLHGGGWVLGGGDVYDAAAAGLADDVGAVVAAVDYPLAPEHPFPAPLEGAQAAIRALLADPPAGTDPARCALVGDSAGANLAAVAALALRDEGRPPAAMLLVYPPPDFEGRYPSVTENAEGYWLTASDVKACSKLYLAGHDPRGDVRLSPLRAPSLAGLPPTIVATAGFDPLRDAGHAFADALAAAGVDARRREHPALVHGFYGFRAAVPAADTAVRALHAELAGLLGR
ncbi:alpha/beta hydrolase [Actinomycetospora chlora]|uniref:Alpha/beta hydrolase n=2 Tax=Actinomycetospora chlora TaxID=663608 RepID=A0ABP9B9P8_9PSEU